MVQEYGHSIKVSAEYYTSLKDDCHLIAAVLQSQKSEIGQIVSARKSLDELVQETLDGKFFDEEST